MPASVRLIRKHQALRASRWSHPAIAIPCLLLSLAAGADSRTPAEPEPPREEQGTRESPALPPGLEPASQASKTPEPASTDSGPPLPSGLGSSSAPSSAPPLPSGLSEQAAQPRPLEGSTKAADIAGPLSGFIEIRGGMRLQSDPNQESLSLGETRLQLSRDQYFGEAMLRLTADFVYDDVADSHRIRLEPGQGWLDLREAFVSAPLGERLDVRMGRQVLTWGVGDLLFLNDLFPKDWNAFFVGRDVDYLKAPSDAVRLALFGELFNVDLVYTPRFDADRYLDPRRLSFYDPRIGAVAGRNVEFDPQLPNEWFEDDEWALRLHRLLGGWELAAYGYRGFWKSPEGFDAASGRPIFSKLAAWGGSIRGPLHTGILSAETSWYRSRDDLDGTDPFVPNSQFRFLVGYEQEVVPDLMLGAQYYLERILDFGALKRNQPAGFPFPDENRHLFTLRLTLLTHAQNVTWSLFSFASPSDRDAYLRGLWSWKATDAWTVSAGFNLFEGRDNSSFFGQFERNSNAYLGLRYGF
ncbi:MAG: hypothetical protein CVV18_06870 [Gammaproteobacteria bacterium HGW-Gammaproteobacteria-8]|nr:MAG: hypothetical protein CVV18_06870 [Gammaproteobacteria bacterium HGW-Gammaproteobacteria-8]